MRGNNNYVEMKGFLSDFSEDTSYSSDENERMIVKELSDDVEVKGLTRSTRAAVGHTLGGAGIGALNAGALGAGIGALSGKEGKRWESAKRGAQVGAGLGAVAGGAIGGHGVKRAVKADIRAGLRKARKRRARKKQG